MRLILANVQSQGKLSAFPITNACESLHHGARMAAKKKRPVDGPPPITRNSLSVQSVMQYNSETAFYKWGEFSPLQRVNGAI